MTIKLERLDLLRVLRWPFRSPLLSPLWLGLRIYLGLVWLRFGWSKVESGWLTTDAIEPLLRAIATGAVDTPLGLYAPVADLMVRTGFTPVLSTLIPIAEVAFGVAFLSGVLLVPTAIAATMMNANLLLAGIAAWSFDGKIIVLQLLVALGWRSAIELGLHDSLGRLGGYYRSAYRDLRRA